MAVQIRKEKPIPVSESGFDVSLDRLVQLDVEISEAKKSIERLTDERAGLLKTLIKEGIRHQGNWSLVKKEQTRQTVDNEKLKRLFPTVYAELAKIKVSTTELRKRIGGDSMDKVCTSKTYTDYVTVYDPHNHESDNSS